MNIDFFGFNRKLNLVGGIICFIPMVVLLTLMFIVSIPFGMSKKRLR